STWGIFPACVISIRPCTIKGSGIAAIAELKDDPLVREIACVLREWARLWKKLYVRAPGAARRDSNPGSDTGTPTEARRQTRLGE
ncbi:Dedicator of cytokinesis protein 3-like protein-1, partial [Operophtera brumata]